MSTRSRRRTRARLLRVGHPRAGSSQPGRLLRGDRRHPPPIRSLHSHPLRAGAQVRLHLLQHRRIRVGRSRRPRPHLAADQPLPSLARSPGSQIDASADAQGYAVRPAGAEKSLVGDLGPAFSERPGPLALRGHCRHGHPEPSQGEPKKLLTARVVLPIHDHEHHCSRQRRADLDWALLSPIWSAVLPALRYVVRESSWIGRRALQ